MAGTLDIPIRLRARAELSLPAADMVIGMQTGQAAELLPRIFNLCRTAQSTAARLAFGMPLAPEADRALAHDIFKDHVLKVAFKWPLHLAQKPMALPKGWQTTPEALRALLFGPAEALPDDYDGFRAMLDRCEGVGQVLSRLRGAFAPFEAASSPVPFACARSAFSVMIQDNSVASRQASHPVLQQIERGLGRGPLWRAAAVVYDMQSCLDGAVPPAALISAGRAIVPASRGLYMIEAAVKDDSVTAFRRITPTDHLLARGGIMDQSLASLTPKNHALAPLVVDILDPCVPVTLEEVRHA